MTELFSWISHQSLTWLVATLVIFAISSLIYRRFGGRALLHPMMISIVVLILLLKLSDVSYTHYFEANRTIHWLLGPATVALAVPLYDHFSHVRKLCTPLLTLCVLGGLVAAITAVTFAWLLGLHDETLLASLAPKSTTTPVAIGISEKIGGVVALTTGAVLVTGVIGCLLEPTLSRWFGIDDERIRGMALGIAAHGIGTAHAFKYGVLSGVMASVTMTLTATLSGFLLPWIYLWLR